MVMSFQEKNVTVYFAVLLFSTSLLLTGCASNEVVDSEVVPVEVSEVDPYEGFNRSMYSFNEGLDEYVAEPISDAYLYVTPQFVQTGVANFFNNLGDINVVLNDVMQGKMMQGAEDTGRFAVNSTIGLLGLFDVATELGLEKHDEDFAQTLAVWGVPQGPYLVLPVLGPSTGRGIPGSVFDTAANPASYVGFPVQMLQMLNARANAEGSLNFIDEAALDPYVFTRESFLQYRKHLITDGSSEVSDDVLDLEDEFYDEDELSEPTADNVSVDSSQLSTVGLSEPANLETQPLTLTKEGEGFNRASESLDSAVKSLDEAANSFEEASEKLNNIEQ